jgi:magnesium chelatase family protein
MFVGTPGSGKSMLAGVCRQSCRLCPPRGVKHVDDPFSGRALDEGGISRTRPFRKPHHTASMATIIAGGRQAKPGEVSLEHNGVLFMDEFSEFPRMVLETLRQPIETGEVMIARANAHVKYPCKFMLVAAANPCKSGYLSDSARACSKAQNCGYDYIGHISGPLMDRFDLRVDVLPVAFTDLDLPRAGDGSAEVAARVAGARQTQKSRFSQHSGVSLSADAEGDFLERVADLDGSDTLRKPHLAEALSFCLPESAAL